MNTEFSNWEGGVPMKPQQSTKGTKMNDDSYYESIVYIAGPMTGLPNYNFEAFNTAAAILRFAYPEILVLNPAENFDAVQTHPREVYMRQDIKQLMRADTIVMLDGWQASEGATLEYDIAEALSLEIKVLDMDRSGITWRDINGYDLDVRDDADMGEECGLDLEEGDLYTLELRSGYITVADVNSCYLDGSAYFTIEADLPYAWEGMHAASEMEETVLLYHSPHLDPVEFLVSDVSPMYAGGDGEAEHFYLLLSPIK
jgi:hypothetical protein